MVYTYSSIMSSYATNHALPSSATVNPWKTVTAVKFTTDQVASAATWVKNYVDTNKKLPDYVTINGITVSMPSFLQLLTTATININNGNSASLIALYTCGNAPSPRDEIKSGTMQKSEYLKIAGDVKSFMDSRLVAPEYAYGTSLGYYFGYQNMVYTYSSIMSSYATNHALPSSATVNPWVKFNVNEVVSAASSVKAYIDANKRLPDYVTINGTNVSMPSFLQLLTTATININNKNLNSVIYLYNCGNAPNPRDSMQTGSMSTTEYLKIAGDVKSFMDSRGVAPEYAYGTSLGSYFGYENMVYSYSKILDYYNQNKILPSSVDVKQWVYPNAVPSELIPYTQSSANCQSNDASIKALATSITQNYATTYDKATAIFNWVRDNLSYSFYYNTKYGAVGALNARTGNCVDTAHLVVALSRAAGIPAKYVHGTCQFSSGSWYGHVWAQIWVDGKWYTADATSNYNTFGVINNWNTGTYTLKGTYISLPF
jgi:hypothetical protein